MLHNFSNTLSSAENPASLKHAEKDDKTDKTNYRPIGIFPNVSKVYERFMQNQMYSQPSQVFSKYQCGFKRGYNAQHCSMAMI